MRRNWWVILIALVTPILIATLSRVPIFKYSPGSVESWIGYWGSYLGAIIGASVVYFVSKMQIKEQNQLQLDAIDKENEITLNREMEQYYFRLEVDKLEEFFGEIDTLNTVSTNIYNDFVLYLTNTRDLFSGRTKLNEEQEERLPLEVRRIKIDLYKWMGEGYSSILILKRLSLYVDDCEPIMIEIEELYKSYMDEMKRAYQNNHSYEDYLSSENAENSDMLSDNMEELHSQINNLSVNILQPNLQEKINIMRNSQAL